MTMAAPHPVPNRESGFTLIEVLAALALASLVLVSLNLAMSAIERGVSKTQASLGRQSALGAAADISGAMSQASSSCGWKTGHTSSRAAAGI